jgi:hypothetical protein
MKKLLFGILVVASGLVFFSCTQKSGFLGSDTLKTSELVAADSQIDNLVETASYESDVFSLGNSSITTYTDGLKSAVIGRGIFNNMFNLFPNFKLRYLRGICPDLTIVTTNGGFPKTMTVDYGTGLELANGHILKGKIIIVLSAAPLISGSTRTVTFENFCADLVCISGTSVKTRTKDAQPKFSETCNFTITLANGTIINRTGENVRSWIAGSDTEFNPADDVVEVTGEVVVSDSKGNEYSKTITTPLLKTGVCKFITKGVIEYKNSTGKFASVDFGNGDCDNKAIRTTQKGTTEITLGK